MRRILVIGLLGILGPLFLTGTAQAYVGLCCSHCGGNMPLNIPGAGIPNPKEWRIKVNETYMRMGGLRDGTSNVSTDSLFGMASMGKYPAVPKTMDMWMSNVSAGYSINGDWAVMGMLMVMNNTMPMRRMASMGGDFTMKSSGLADSMLMAKYRLYADDPLVPTRQASLLFGVSLPTGSITKKTSSGMLLPYSMQLGSGTVDPILGFQASASRSPWWWGMNVMATGRLHKNSKDYRLGHELRYDFYVMRQVRYDTVLELQFNGKVWGKVSNEREEGRAGAGHVMGKPMMGFMSPLFDPDNYGGHRVDLTAGIQWQPKSLHILNLQVSVPVYQNLRGPQMRRDVRVMALYYVEIPTKKSWRYISPEAPKELGF